MSKSGKLMLAAPVKLVKNSKENDYAHKEIIISDSPVNDERLAAYTSVPSQGTG
ncbi:hypothetical protein ABRS97_13410 [Paenibacillus sp. SI92]